MDKPLTLPATLEGLILTTNMPQDTSLPSSLPDATPLPSAPTPHVTHLVVAQVQVGDADVVRQPAGQHARPVIIQAVGGQLQVHQRLAVAQGTCQAAAVRQLHAKQGTVILQAQAGEAISDG